MHLCAKIVNSCTLITKIMFILIFNLDTKSRNVSEKKSHMKKKVIYALLLENRFLVVFRKIEKIGFRKIECPPKFFIRHFPISQFLNYSFMSKKSFKKIIYGGFREFYLKNFWIL
jgi:hypothetical protein